MPPVNSPDRPGPANGPPIVHEPPGYADALIEIIDIIETNRRINLDAAKSLETKRDALKAILQSAFVDAGLERVFDPATESMRSVSYADRRTKALAIDVLSEPCGNSTKVRLSEELRGKVAEILGGKADAPAPPKVAEVDGGHDERPRLISGPIASEQPELERLRYTRGPTDSLDAVPVDEIVGLHDGAAGAVSLALDRALAHVSNRPRPVVSPAFGGPPHADQ